ncbi:MAG: hypothetical protein QF578_19200 [Alphaproteobacteria bacterium]|jgi:hypothetical protein|nr:hypothetical protein [Alphaproteobacteria bacterium]MDP6566963.1 hypothetical protein [Alphaproteobacteria bacterium]MDP6813763.1 hypothetical protein [Alphaproteobacteria bacterium]
MNEQILNANGTLTMVGDAGSAVGIIAGRVAAATVPATYDAEGNEVTPAVVPDAADVAVEITGAALKTHAWRLPAAKVERLAEIRAARDAKLEALDVDALIAWENGDDPAAIRTQKQALRDLPPVAEAALAALTDTDAIAAYLPAELQ